MVVIYISYDDTLAEKAKVIVYLRTPKGRKANLAFSTTICGVTY
jgi:hypothetical protein